MPDGYDAVPEELRSRDQWVCWSEETRDGNVTKIPKRPDGEGNARSNDMATWGSFEEAIATAEEHDYGIGFVFSAADPYVGIDIDGCLRDTDRVRPEDWLPTLEAFTDTYIEVSPSGDGLHIIIKETRLPDWWKNQVRHRDKTPDFFDDLDLDSEHDEVGVEVYEDGRYFTVTGSALEDIGAPRVESVPELYEWLTAAWLVFNDDVPGPEGESQGGDVDLNVYDILSRSEYPPGERREHPVHGSSTGANFMVDPGGETWRCWSGGHQCTGDALHLVGMQEGYIECGEWVNGSISSETWTDVFDAARERGLIPDDRDEDRERAPDLEDVESSSAPDPGGPWMEFRDGYQYAENTRQKQSVRYRITRWLLGDRPFAAHEESDTLYVYNPTTGTYEARGEPYVKRTLVHGLNHHYTRQENNEITDQIRGHSYTRAEAFGGPENKITITNGVLDLDEMTLESHNPDYLFLSSMPVEYDPDADCPLWMEFLRDAIPMEIDRMKIQEYVGYTLMHWSLPYHKALFIVGPTASGKSTFLDTVRALLGPETVSSITPQELVDERFAAVELFGAWANIRNDIPAGVIENTGKFKELVAGDPIKAERKYEPTFTFEPKAKHLYSANQLPEASVDDDAFYRRIMLVSFPSTVPINNRDPLLPQKLESELPGILNWAIEGYHRLRDNGGFTGARNPTEIRETWESWGSTVERFKQDALEKVPDGSVPKHVAHSAYVWFCEEHGLPAAVTQNQLTRKLAQDKDIDQGRRSIDGNRQRCYLGVELKKDWDPRERISDDELADDHGLGDFGTQTE